MLSWGEMQRKAACADSFRPAIVQYDPPCDRRSTYKIAQHPAHRHTAAVVKHRDVDRNRDWWLAQIAVIDLNTGAVHPRPR